MGKFDRVLKGSAKSSLLVVFYTTLPRCSTFLNHMQMRKMIMMITGMPTIV
jgi:hypothetical protein